MTKINHASLAEMDRAYDEAKPAFAQLLVDLMQRGFSPRQVAAFMLAYATDGWVNLDGLEKTAHLMRSQATNLERQILVREPPVGTA